ncbi:type II toxin-antitoxin system TacA family antitoxin [Escherichia coli]|uniref:type II toxin-antitoxin system TacA family antitoxin n=1 Tax=Escherichia coli TaxID=562 RepID=UPI0021581B50|nr:DUF1778 domain-containing protein [Escherichia coli]
MLFTSFSGSLVSRIPGAVQSISQFMVSTASERAAEVIDQHRRLLLNEESWNLVMDAITNPPAPNDRLKRAANRLRELE